MNIMVGLLGVEKQWWEKNVSGFFEDEEKYLLTFEDGRATTYSKIHYKVLKEYITASE